MTAAVVIRTPFVLETSQGMKETLDIETQGRIPGLNTGTDVI